MNKDQIDNLKRRIRKLKQFELLTRAEHNMGVGTSLVWSKFFDLRSGGSSTITKINRDDSSNNALYSLPKLASMSREEYKRVIEDFFARVYYEIYAFKGITNEIVYDPAILAKLGLSSIADEVAVKKKFRELAKKYHPDAGGEHEKFIELMEIYEEL